MLALFIGLEENLNSSLLFGQAAFTFCWGHNLLVVVNDFVRE